MTGLLLINLGTPQSPTSREVARYLRQFLMDPYVIDIPAPLRWILVNLIIAPIRSPKSAAAYRTVWTEKGSPLLVHHLSLRDQVRAQLRAQRGVDADVAVQVEAGMRYGEPSIGSALKKLKAQGVSRLIVLPLYPQYAESTTRSSEDEVQRVLAELGWSPELKWVKPFFAEDLHIKAWARTILNSGFQVDDSTSHLLFSYHGLPERHLQKIEVQGHCTKAWCLDGGSPTQAESLKRNYQCCDKVAELRDWRSSDSSASLNRSGGVAANGGQAAARYCYRAQCLVTSRLIAAELGLGAGQWSMSFQSRLGRTPWIRPYTDEVIPKLAEAGVEHLFVATPSFVADCLETIEEIGDRAKELFHEAKGPRFTRVPCLNDSISDFCVSVVKAI